MSTDTIYQQLRGHLHYLKLTAIAEQLATALQHAERQRPGYTEFLASLPARHFSSSITTPSPHWTGA
jgi:hypothetical protein